MNCRKEDSATIMCEKRPLRNDLIKPKRSLRFKVGVFFLIINIPFGYGVAPLAAVIGMKMGKPAFGAGLCIGIYIISWIMLGLGVWMAGPEGVQLVKDLRRKCFKSKNTGPADPSA